MRCLAAAFDAHYLAVAARAGTLLWMADARLVRALGEAGSHLVRRVQVVDPAHTPPCCAAHGARVPASRRGAQRSPGEHPGPRMAAASTAGLPAPAAAVSDRQPPPAPKAPGPVKIIAALHRSGLGSPDFDGIDLPARAPQSPARPETQQAFEFAA